MGRKRYTVEQIIHMLREAEVELARGLNVGRQNIPDIQWRFLRDGS